MQFEFCLALGLFCSDGPRGAAPPVVRGVILPAVLPTRMTTEVAEELLGLPSMTDGFRNQETWHYRRYGLRLDFEDRWLRAVEWVDR